MNPHILYVLLIAPALFIIFIIIFIIIKVTRKMNKESTYTVDKTEFIKMKPSEAQLLHDLAVEIWTEHFTPIIGKEQVEYMLELMYSLKQIKKDLIGGLEYHLIMYNNVACGFFGIKNQSEKLFINRIYIRKEMRGKKIGKKVINFIIDTAKYRQQSSLYLTCNKNNTDSIEFYKICGFEITDNKIADIGKGFKMDDYILTLTL